MQCWTREKKTGEKYVTCNSNTKKKPKKKLKIVRKRVIKPRKKKLKIIRRRVVKSKRELLEEARQKKNLEMARKPTPGFAEAIVMNNPMFRKAIFSNFSKNPMGEYMKGLTKRQKTIRRNKLEDLRRDHVFVKSEVDAAQKTMFDKWENFDNRDSSDINEHFRSQYEWADYWRSKDPHGGRAWDPVGPRRAPAHIMGKGTKLRKMKDKDWEKLREATKVKKDPKKMKQDIKTYKQFIMDESIARSKGKKVKSVSSKLNYSTIYGERPPPPKKEPAVKKGFLNRRKKGIF